MEGMAVQDQKRVLVTVLLIQILNAASIRVLELYVLNIVMEKGLYD